MKLVKVYPKESLYRELKKKLPWIADSFEDFVNEAVRRYLMDTQMIAAKS